MSKLLILIFSLICTTLFAQSEEEILQQNILSLEHNNGNHHGELKQREKVRKDLLIQLYRLYQANIGYPISDSLSDSIYHHFAYSFSYNKINHHANWTTHILSPELAKHFYYRTESFRSDSLIKNEIIFKEDYDDKNYDRGHLVPSADFHWSDKLINETYLYSNVAPQNPNFNRQSWKELEERLRDYVVNTKRPLYVVTGVYSPQTSSFIGVNNKIAVPSYFYKVIYDFKDSLQKGIAFLLPNDNNNLSCFHYAVSIDSLEKLTGITFLTNIKNKDCKKKLEVNEWMIQMQHFYPINPKNTLENNDQAFLCGKVINEKGKYYLDAHPFAEKYELQFKFDQNPKLFPKNKQPYVTPHVCLLGQLTKNEEIKMISIESFTDIYSIDKQ